MTFFFFCLLKNWRHHQASELLYCALQLYGHGVEVKMIYSAGVHGGGGGGGNTASFSSRRRYPQVAMCSGFESAAALPILHLETGPALQQCLALNRWGKEGGNLSSSSTWFRRGGGGNGDDEQRRHCTALQRLERGGGGRVGEGMSTKPLTTRWRHLHICIEPLESANQGKGKDNAHYEELTRHFLHFRADWSSTYFFNQQFFSPRQS